MNMVVFFLIYSLTVKFKTFGKNDIVCVTYIVMNKSYDLTWQFMRKEIGKIREHSAIAWLLAASLVC